VADRPRRARHASTWPLPRGRADGGRAAGLPGRDIVLDAQSPLAGWYAKFGFSVTGPEFLDDGIPHLPMRPVDDSGTTSV
jgi:hypothetical protein